MSFVSVTRDYIEFLNNLIDSFNGGFSFPEVFKETSFYLLKTVQYILIYIFTLQWLRDFTLLPIIIPQISTSLIKEKFFLETSSNLFFNFLEVPSFQQNSFLLGYFNSIALTLPVSIIHVISIRRLYIKGIPSAVFSIAGYLAGQICFISCVIFGFRNIITPWFSCEPLNYFLGVFLIFRVIYTMTQENLREINTWNHPEYKNFFIVSFIIAWCEQSSIFQYLGNLNFSAQSSLLESTHFQATSDHFFYIFGLLLGSIVFTILWGTLFLQIKNLLLEDTSLFVSNFIKTINTTSFVVAIALSLSSIPFYGLDYLSTAPLGFVSQDKVFKNTILDQYNIKDSILGLGISSGFASVDIDISPFDRGRYIIYPERTTPFDFEDLNYRGEADWTSRYDKVSTITNRKAGFLSLAKLLKKQNSQNAVKLEKDTSKLENSFPIQSNFETNILDSRGLETKEPRFSDWYTFDKTISPDEGNSLESIFAETQDTTFPLDFTRINSIEPDNIDFKIKQKYYSNPIYQNLLSFDIDLFLNRQPAQFKISSNEEFDLYTKRRALANYYDSLRDYSKLPYSIEFEDFFHGTKSFANKVYNQQFKGTLRSVSRLFSLTNDIESNLQADQRILKYDQPLYVFNKNLKFSSYHEELNKARGQKTETEILPNIFSGPLYGGWDERLRKFVITNKFLPRSLTGYKINFAKDIKSQKELNTNKFLNQPDKNVGTYKIKFTSWPINQKVLDEGKNNSIIPFSILYTPKSEFGISGDPAFENLSTLPGNWETRNRRAGIVQTYENIFDYLAPQRGGFIWPGNKNLKFK